MRQERSKRIGTDGKEVDWHDALAHGGQGKDNMLRHRLYYSFRLDCSFPHLSGRESTRSGLNITTVNINY